MDELNGGCSINKGTWNNSITLTIGVKDGSGTFSGAITMNNSFQPPLSLLKQGIGTQILSGNNYTDSTTANADTLQIGDGGTTDSLGDGVVPELRVYGR